MITVTYMPTTDRQRQGYLSPWWTSYVLHFPSHESFMKFLYNFVCDTCKQEKDILNCMCSYELWIDDPYNLIKNETKK